MIERKVGRLDGLLHNASIIGPRTSVEHLPGEDFMQVMHVNVNATFMLTQALLPLLRRSTDASVAFTSSSVGRKGRAQWGAYGVSKFATEGLMQTLADELEGVTSVRANSINRALPAPVCVRRPTLTKTRRTIPRPKTSCRSTCT